MSPTSALATGNNKASGFQHQDFTMTQSISISRKRISGGVVHKMPADLKGALASDPHALINSMGGHYTARTQRVDMLD